MANSISNRLGDDIIPKMVDNVVNYVTKCTETYKEQLTFHKKELEDEYQKLLEDQENNDSIRANIEDLERKLKVIEEGMASISGLKEELKNYVEE